MTKVDNQTPAAETGQVASFGDTLANIQTTMAQLASTNPLETVDASIAHAKEHGRDALAGKLTDLRDSLSVLLDTETV